MTASTLSPPVYSASVLLSSVSKARREEWEAPVLGGVAIVGELVSALHQDFDPQPPKAPRPESPSPPEMASVASHLTTLLAL
jgi:hypothetical protein